MKAEVHHTRVHRLLLPRPVVLLTTRYRDRVNVMPLAWACPVSLEPPLVMLAVHPACYSHDLLRRSEEAVLNFPGRAMAEQVLRCGQTSGHDVDKLESLALAAESGQRVEVPWLADCLAHIECAVVEALAPGDHTLFIAEVLGAWAEEEAFQEQWLGPTDNEELHPLLHLGGDSFSLLGQTIPHRQNEA